MEIKKQSFARFLFTGERGVFLCIMLGFILLLSGFWAYDYRNPFYTFKTDGAGYAAFIAGIVLIILGTIAQAFFSDYPKHKKETGTRGK